MAKLIKSLPKWLFLCLRFLLLLNRESDPIEYIIFLSFLTHIKKVICILTLLSGRFFVTFIWGQTVDANKRKIRENNKRKRKKKKIGAT